VVTVSLGKAFAALCKAGADSLALALAGALALACGRWEILSRNRRANVASPEAIAVCNPASKDARASSIRFLAMKASAANTSRATKRHKQVLGIT
jgi:hypothetical protein